MPIEYAPNPRPYVDLAWAKLDSSEDTLTVETNVLTPKRVSIFFRQPLDLDGNWISDHSTIGSKDATLYVTPSVQSLAVRGWEQ